MKSAWFAIGVSGGRSQSEKSAELRGPCQLPSGCTASKWPSVCRPRFAIQSRRTSRPLVSCCPCHPPVLILRECTAKRTWRQVREKQKRPAFNEGRARTDSDCAKRGRRFWPGPRSERVSMCPDGIPLAGVAMKLWRANHVPPPWSREGLTLCGIQPRGRGRRPGSWSRPSTSDFRLPTSRLQLRHSAGLGRMGLTSFHLCALASGLTGRLNTVFSCQFPEIIVAVNLMSNARILHGGNLVGILDAQPRQ